MNRARSLVLVATVALGLMAGCKSQCRQLTEKLCDCAETTVLRQQCLTEASTKDSTYGSNPGSEPICQALLTGGQLPDGGATAACDCHNLATAAGKRACGLAR